MMAKKKDVRTVLIDHLSTLCEDCPKCGETILADELIDQIEEGMTIGEFECPHCEAKLTGELTMYFVLYEE